MLSDAQKTKLEAAIEPLYADPDFAGVKDILEEVTLVPPQPAPETDSLDVPPTPVTPPESELPAPPTNS